MVMQYVYYLQLASCSCPPPWILENPEYLDWRVSAARLKYIPSGSPTFARLAVTLLFCQFPLAIDLPLVGESFEDLFWFVTSTWSDDHLGLDFM